MMPEILSHWTISKENPPSVVFVVVEQIRPGWWTLEVLHDAREDRHEVGFRFEVEAAWFEMRGRKL